MAAKLASRRYTPAEFDKLLSGVSIEELGFYWFRQFAVGDYLLSLGLDWQLVVDTPRFIAEHGIRLDVLLVMHGCYLHTFDSSILSELDETTVSHLRALAIARDFQKNARPVVRPGGLPADIR